MLFSKLLKRQRPEYAFTCNICGIRNAVHIDSLDREVPSCNRCHSTVRMRSIAAILIKELTGKYNTLLETESNHNIRGVGLSDWDGYARILASKYNYTNTYYHKEPKLDIMNVPESMIGKMDFVIATDVFEHVPIPATNAFVNTRSLLKPDGVFVFSVPYKLEGSALEHFPELHKYQLKKKDGKFVLLNTTKNGVRQEFDDLVFHGGEGDTLEMRVFSESNLLEIFETAGFSDVKIWGDEYSNYGIRWPNQWSLPISARP